MPQRDLKLAILLSSPYGQKPPAGVGEIAWGRAAIERARDQCHSNKEFWYLPELLRIKGEVLLRQRGPDAPREAERWFLESLDWSRRQRTAGWELRTAVSLGDLWRHQGRAEDARNLIAASYTRFTEGFETADLQAARRLLSELGQGAEAG